MVLKSVSAGTATITSMQQFTVTIQLPYTDSVGLPSLTGASYSPFASTISNCSNIFSYVALNPL